MRPPQRGLALALDVRLLGQGDLRPEKGLERNGTFFASLWHVGAFRPDVPPWTRRISAAPAVPTVAPALKLCGTHGWSIELQPRHTGEPAGGPAARPVMLQVDAMRCAPAGYAARRYPRQDRPPVPAGAADPMATALRRIGQTSTSIRKPMISMVLYLA